MQPASLPYKPHWLGRFEWIAWVVIACLFVPMFTDLGHRYILVRDPSDIIELVNAWFRGLGMFGIFIWYTWCQPMVWAYDPSKITKLKKWPPKKVAGFLNLGPLLGLLTPVLVVVVSFIAVMVEWDRPERWANLLWFVFSCTLLCVAFFVCRRVRRVCRREFPRRLLLLNICHSCGYNLQGSVSPNCPECGLELDHPPHLRAETLNVSPAIDR